MSAPARSADVAADKQSTTVLKEEHFDKDPGWEGLNNRLVPDPKDIPAIQQNFGYSQTSFAGGDAGEIDGRQHRRLIRKFRA